MGPADASVEPLAGCLGRIPTCMGWSALQCAARSHGRDQCRPHLGWPPAPEDATVLGALVRAGKGWLHVANDAGLPPPVFGVGVEPLLPETELRVGWENQDIRWRLPRSFYAGRTRLALQPREEGTTTVLYADWQYGRRPVMTVRPHGAGRAVCTTLGDLGHRRPHRWDAAVPDWRPGRHRGRVRVSPAADVQRHGDDGRHRAAPRRLHPVGARGALHPAGGDSEAGEVLRVAGADEYRLMVEHFARAVRGEEGLDVLPEDSILNMVALDALALAAREERTVHP